METSGWNGEREYSYVVIADASTILPQILDALQQGEPSSSYLQMESAYRDFVDSYALAVPQEFVDELGALLEETRKNLNFSGELSKEQAQLCALSFLETCFGGDTSLPLDSTAKGTTYQYATVAALALRYYGIPARYAEGFTVKTAENENVSVTDENAEAWVEVYQDGVGWLPLALTPGLESLAPEQTESGIKPVGTGEGEGSGPRVTEGQEPEQDDAEQSEDPDNTPDGGQRTGLLAKPAFWILLIAGILLLFVLFILIRHHIILKNRQKTFENPDNSGVHFQPVLRCSKAPVRPRLRSKRRLDADAVWPNFRTLWRRDRKRVPRHGLPERTGALFLESAGRHSARIDAEFP